MKQQKVKIIGLSINKDFGGLKATELEFNSKNKLTIIKGEVGSGKTTLNRALRLTTQGSNTLVDKALYGDIDVVTQLVDGDRKIFVGCRSNADESLSYFLYEIKDGKKIKDVVLDGVKATPANYLKSLQTALTWRLDELTSENAITQRNILLELYELELEKTGVVFDKTHPKYVDGIIDKIEKAKVDRNVMDARRKEVGGIADDMTQKGIDYEIIRKVKSEDNASKLVAKIAAKIELAETNIEQTRKSKLNELWANISDINTELRALHDTIIVNNAAYDKRQSSLTKINAQLIALELDENAKQLVIDTIKRNLKDIATLESELFFNDEGKCFTKVKHYEGSSEILMLLKKYSKLKKKYKKLENKEYEIDNTELEEEKVIAEKALTTVQDYNKEAEAVNAFWDWRKADENVRSIKKDYYLKLTKINTGVKGLHIVPSETDESQIHLMYNGAYDKEYFNNPDKELRKLSSYSGTQKPMICLLIQSYLLSKKNKVLPYLWIDNIALDKKTIQLLGKMAKELKLWLFVNWTGDFKVKNLKNGEILLENGEIFLHE